MAKNYYASGEFNLICDVCGKKIKAHDSRHRWDGLVVCKEDYEQRHPQDFVRARQDKISIPFNRPRPVDAFRLLQPAFDSVSILDDDEVCDYLLTYSDYFESDYLVDAKSFYIVVTFYRGFTDTELVSDTIVKQISTQQTSTTTLNDTSAKAVGKHLSDTINITEAGIIFVNNYVEVGYFASDYVGTLTTF